MFSFQSGELSLYLVWPFSGFPEYEFFLCAGQDFKKFNSVLLIISLKFMILAGQKGKIPING
jgi:hypothetical protein